MTQRELGQYMTRPDVADLMVSAIESDPSSWRVLDPACGDGNLLLAVARRLAEHGIKDIHQRIAGVDIDPKMIAAARERLTAQLGAAPRLEQGDFLASPASFQANVILANPPYGKLREYRFFKTACDRFRGAEVVFLVPLAFLDRTSGILAVPIQGRPLGVTTGHAIVHHVAGQPFEVTSTRGHQTNASPFTVCVGLKLYEVGAGMPPQTRKVTAEKPFSSDKPKPGWIPCVRTGDIHAYRIETGRLWVQYGPHLAHPKDLERFSGPRLFVRRMPIWGTRQLGAVYLDETTLCTSDILIVRHEANDPEQLRGLCVFLNSPEAATFVLQARPSVAHRDSYPKISAKDINRLLDYAAPSQKELSRSAQRYGEQT